MNALVLDNTAVLALGGGNQELSRLVREVHDSGHVRVYIPTLCLVAAEVHRAGVADHVGMLPALEILDLDYTAVRTIGSIIDAGVAWGTAQAVQSGQPSIEWPHGRPVITATPDVYQQWGVTTIRLT